MVAKMQMMVDMMAQLHNRTMILMPIRYCTCLGVQDLEELLRKYYTQQISSWTLLKVQVFQKCFILGQLKVLDQITLENKFCLNFKIRSVFI